MNFYPAMNLLPMMVIIQPGRVMPNELWTVKAIDEKNCLISFYEHDIVLGFGADPMVQVPVVGERLSWPSQTIAFAGRRNENRYDTSWKQEIQEERPHVASPPADPDRPTHKEETREVLQNCIDNTIEAMATFVHRGQIAGYWSVNDKMLAVHLSLEEAISKTK